MLNLPSWTYILGLTFSCQAAKTTLSRATLQLEANRSWICSAEFLITLSHVSHTVQKMPDNRTHARTHTNTHTTRTPRNKSDSTRDGNTQLHFSCIWWFFLSLNVVEKTIVQHMFILTGRRAIDRSTFPNVSRLTGSLTHARSRELASAVVTRGWWWSHWRCDSWCTFDERMR